MKPSEQLGKERLIWMWTQMVRIREFEERVKRTFVEHPGMIRGHTHLGDGAEASIVGSLATRNDGDPVMPSYRCHGYPIVLGTPTTSIMAELYGRKDGLCGGFGGSMHLADPAHDFPGAVGIIGAGIAHAAGVALTAQVKKTGQVVYSFFGDGASKQGAFHESLNIAAVWKLPVVFILENNEYQAYTHISLLQGLSFALFYTLAGLPLGKLADTYSRRRLITSGIVAWSVLTAACSAAKKFWPLFFTRMGVGVGEAALSPSAFSLIADCFPSGQLGLALSVYSMGIYFGSGLAMIVGGSVVQSLSRRPELILPVLGAIASWRATFLVVGVPGLLIALLTLTIREPQRRSLLRSADGQVVRPSFRDVIEHLRRRKWSVAGISLGMVFQSVCGYAFLAWGPTFLQRTYEWTPVKSGRVLGVLILILGCLGMYAGGSLSDYWQRRGMPEAPLRVGVFSAAGSAIFFPLALTIGNATWTTLLLAAAIFLLALPIGCSYAALQLIFPNQLRGQMSALFLFVMSFGGVTLGPLLPGLLNDYVFRSEKMLGASMALTIGGAAILMWSACLAAYRPYREDYRAAQSSQSH